MTDVQVPTSAVQPTPFEEVAGQFLAYLRASGCSPNTVRAYGHDLTRLAAFLVEQGLHWRVLTPARAVDLLIHLRNKRSRRRGPAGYRPSLATIEGGRAIARLSAATINRTLAAVSSFYDWAQATDRFTGPGPIVRVHNRAAARISEHNRPLLDGIGLQPLARSPVRLRDVRRVPRPMAGEHVDALIAQLRCRRDLALIRLMLDGGLRPGEVLGLQLTDIA